MITNICIICSLLALLGTITIGVAFIYTNRAKPTTPPTTKLNLSYEDVNVIIEGIITEIFNNKYLLYYRLKEITVIPKMDEEVTNITKEVINAFSDTLIHEFNNYYSKDFLVKMITRKVQILLVDYTNTHKPNTK